MIQDPNVERLIRKSIEPLNKQISMLQIELEGLKKQLAIPHVSVSLRDKFAMMAVSGYTSATNQEGTWTSDGCGSDIAKHAYDIADEMIKARDKSNER